MLQQGNEKLKETGRINGCDTYTFTLPPILSCPAAKECVKYCYYKMLCDIRKYVRENASRNFEISKSEHFIPLMTDELIKAKIKAEKKNRLVLVRLHDGGDFYSEEYVGLWVRIMEYFPDILFYAYSKSHAMLTNMPSNFLLIPSLGGKDDHLLADKPCAKVVPENGYQLQRGEVWGSEDEVVNLYNVCMRKKTICMRAHGARKGRVK